MKRSARPTRARKRASALRAEANVAREAFDAWEREGRSLEDPRYEELARAWERAEAGAQAAERREAVEPVRQKREVRARRVTATKEAQSGSRVVKAADAATLQRVACCRGREGEPCGRTAELRGEPGRLWAAGWGSKRDTAAEGWPRLWWCPDCWDPPRLAPGDPDAAHGYAISYPGPDGPVLVHASARPAVRLSAKALESAAERRDSRARARVERDVRRLAEVDPPKAEAALQRLIYAAPSKTVGRAWRAVAREILGVAA
jgi:hypothetical protein